MNEGRRESRDFRTFLEGNVFIETGVRFFGRSTEADRLALCNSDSLGRCVRALVDFAAGDVLDKFTGIVSPRLTQHSLQVGPGQHISGTRFIGFLSHGCDPNCRLDMERFELVALRDIACGDLLTIDYAATEDELYTQFACDCGADTCRGWITGRNDVSRAPQPASFRVAAMR